MRKILRGYAKDRNGNLILIGKIAVPHSKDKPSPRERQEKAHFSVGHLQWPINAQGRTTIAAPTQQQPTSQQAKLADPQDAGATERAAPEPLLVDQPPGRATIRTERGADS
jgi:hypothetical protein